MDSSFLYNAPCGFLTFDDSGHIVHVNKKIAEMLDVHEQELIDQHMETILSPGSTIFYHTHFFPLLRLREEVEEIYLSLSTKSGKKIPVLANARRSEYEGEMLNQCIFVQINQRSEYEDQILEARRIAESESDEKGQFLSVMSHELRSPLQAISTFTELLQRDEDRLDDRQQKFLKRIKNAADNMSRLVNDILNFARLETGRFDISPEVVLVDEALKRAESIVLPKIEKKNMRFEKCDPTSLSVYADPDRLQQILLNLLTNAIKFTASGGRVSITCTSNRQMAYIHVEDTGVGIPPDKINNIFTPFMQVDPDQLEASERGVGLGLAISHELAQIMSGDLTVESTPGNGSTFTVSLPLAD